MRPIKFAQVSYLLYRDDVKRNEAGYLLKPDDWANDSESQLLFRLWSGALLMFPVMENNANRLQPLCILKEPVYSGNQLDESISGIL